MRCNYLPELLLEWKCLVVDISVTSLAWHG
jgi:hypothetical protein